ncbi:aspartate aminotransferase family protein [Acuticoccus sp. MNP-M23]|uniref:aspartate aminotransferase family protein n=1 Tax=Acuticoccus sp. MNP-M23 TaxID=3072793 RepID=UPI002814F929|nr:aspartate aminotransferase family protein [Acuticoccus sp. MNP-M23]WMS41519.1 aspartate aminotransferase family protein [Acuticoccus sp. MNP-M23]
MDARVNRPNDLDAFWMPYTANRAFKAAPRMCVSAKDMHYTTDDGRKILDGSAALWCVNAGHARPRIVEAVQQQVATLDFAPSFQFGHPQAFTLASRLAGMFPDGLDHVFYANSGSEAVDSALKIALAYHRARGEGGRVRLIGRERGYHGSGFGGTAVGGIVKNRIQFGAAVQPVDHMRHTHLAENAFSRGCPAHGADLADDLERMVALHDASSIAAVIVEPMAGSTGVLLPPVGYLKRLREICDRHGILLIFDEVITAFGRLGTASASDYFGVTPDLITLAKGLTNATVPMGAVIASSHIYDTVLAAADAPIEFFHGYTYSGHPLACAAALATLDTYEEEGLFARAAALAPLWEERVHSLRERRNVVDIRNLGLVAAFELAPRPDAPGARGLEAVARAFEAGLMVRVTADIIALSPPLIVSEDQIDEMVGIVGDVIDAIQ